MSLRDALSYCHCEERQRRSNLVIGNEIATLLKSLSFSLYEREIFNNEIATVAKGDLAMTGERMTRSSKWIPAPIPMRGRLFAGMRRACPVPDTGLGYIPE